jgi:arginine exporter protein ArgO
MSTARTDVRFAETAVQKAALIVGIVFLVVGLAGFIPGLTTNFETMQFAGHMSEAMLLGIFQVSILHNIVHLLFGIVGVALARSFSGSRNYLIWGGAIYAVLWIYGLFVGGDHPANFVPLNNADNWLHLVLAVGMILLGVFLGRRTEPRAAEGRVA